MLLQEIKNHTTQGLVERLVFFLALDRINVQRIEFVCIESLERLLHRATYGKLSNIDHKRITAYPEGQCGVATITVQDVEYTCKIKPEDVPTLEGLAERLQQALISRGQLSTREHYNGAGDLYRQVLALEDNPELRAVEVSYWHSSVVAIDKLSDAEKADLMEKRPTVSVGNTTYTLSHKVLKDVLYV